MKTFSLVIKKSSNRLQQTSGQSVEKGKILYFGLARSLIRHFISPNQDDLSDSAWTFFSSLQIR